ncbi:MAG: hypothetical protein ACR2JB_26075 [Bryobacteraceae bacterium]
MIESRFLEDLAVGEVNTTPEVAVSEADIIEFARRYDPQDMHTGAHASSCDVFDARVRPTLARIAEAMQLLNLAGVRIMRYGPELRLGIWEDLDGPELRAAINVVGMDELRVVHLESADVPIRYKVRSCPDRNPGESFEAWQTRALREAPQST